MTTATEHLIQEHAPLVRRYALRLLSRLPSNVELDDLIQAGMIGLMHAARRYQTQVNGAQFATYAGTCIKGSMIDELRRQDWLPRSTRLASRRIEDAIVGVSKELGRPPREDEVAEYMGLSIDEYAKLLDEAEGVQVVHYESMSPGAAGETPDPDGNSQALFIDTIPSEYGDPTAGLTVRDFSRTVLEAIASLPEREQLILSLQFEQNMNNKEISQALDISPGRVSQIRALAIARIRAYLREHDWHDMPKEMEVFV